MLATADAGGQGESKALIRPGQRQCKKFGKKDEKNLSFNVQTRWGDSEDNPSEARMRAILAELDRPDREHPDTWLTYDDGWTIAISERGVATWDNLAADSKPRYRENVSHDEALRLWLLLSRGEFDEIERQDWKDGYGPPITMEEKERHTREVSEITLKMHRDFYETLGPEDTKNPCRHPGCTRGSVKYSVLCRPHHFESIRKTPCPFNG